MKDPLSTDVESGYVEYNDGEKQNKTGGYFWNKPKLYVIATPLCTIILIFISFAFRLMNGEHTWFRSPCGDYWLQLY